ncbi:kinase-like domain-containing protein [Flagelloscypha sp. PMI_526]|nr:kinase-like domain-containing protein [Flagelloscypha sp. PMI_526]
MATDSTIPPPHSALHSETEHWWYEHYNWLEENGYHLRPRYKPGWVPSWELDKSLSIRECEDFKSSGGTRNDAIRISDGAFVYLKRVEKAGNPHEVETTTFLSPTNSTPDPDNHCIPLYDSLIVPNSPEEYVVLALPLQRPSLDPQFATIGEAADFLQQIFKGLRYIHSRHVAHRDVHASNITADALKLFNEPWHPRDLKRTRNGFKPSVLKHVTRTECPVRYYFIDFGLSLKFDPEDADPSALPILGIDKTPPEFKTLDKPCNPFQTDVYCLGNIIRENFLDGSNFEQPKHGFKFLRSLADDMTQTDPAKRPTMDDATRRLDEAVSRLPDSHLRRRYQLKAEGIFDRMSLYFPHRNRTSQFIQKKLPAIPQWKESS